MRTPHFNVTIGKRVIVVLKDGTRFEDHIAGRKQDAVILRKYGRVSKSLIRAFFIKRGDNREGHSPRD